MKTSKLKLALVGLAALVVGAVGGRYTADIPSTQENIPKIQESSLIEQKVEKPTENIRREKFTEETGVVVETKKITMDTNFCYICIKKDKNSFHQSYLVLIPRQVSSEDSIGINEGDRISIREPRTLEDYCITVGAESPSWYEHWHLLTRDDIKVIPHSAQGKR